MSGCGWCGAPIPASAPRRPHRARCERCGAWSTDPLPAEDELDRAYDGWYRPADGRFAGIGDALLRRTRRALARRLDRIAPAGPVLDVGAGDGALLGALRARGRVADGIDRHPSDPTVRDEPLERVLAPRAAVVFWHSLEHLPGAGESLDFACSLLSPGGVAVIAMPNAASLQAAAFGERWFALDYPRHLVHVPASALLGRLRERGLAVERVSYLRGGQVVFGWLHGLVGSLPGRPDLYDAIRRPAARRRPLTGPARLATLFAAALLLPAAVLATGIEVALRRGGTAYVEARRV